MLPATPEIVDGFLAGPRRRLRALDDRERDAAPPMPFVPEERHGELVVMALSVLRRGRGGRGARPRALPPLAEPIADMVQPISYPEIYRPEPEDYTPTVAFRSLFTDRVDARHVIERLEPPSRR